jgi:D-glycero-D-manno-heptose 1,7-bisphosphate phosphatase
MAGLARPRQAVIVAGGRGTRLGALTADRPKPLVEVGGRPFLDALLRSVADRGFERVLLLLGYRAEMVVDYVAGGRRWGLSIDHVATDPDDETGTRFVAAADRLDDRFLFLYGDNLWPMPFERMWQRFTEHDVPAMVAVYANRDGYTRSNVRLDDAGFVVRYDASRSEAGLAGVEIGYAILERSVLDHLADDPDRPLQSAIYAPLIAQRRLLAFLTEHRYYSVGKPERLPITAAYIAGGPAVILDRDGVLNERMPRATYVRSWDEFRWKPGVLDGLRTFREAGFRTFVVSNQAGVARGALTMGELAAIHDRMCREVGAAGGRIDGIYVCPHDWDEGCACRKPAPGMLLQAQRDHQLDLTRTTFIGDDERDAQAADAAGAPSILVDGTLPFADIVDRVITKRLQQEEVP